MQHSSVLECVINISEGTDEDRIGLLGGAAGPVLIHSHSDLDHNRTVFTLVGTEDEVQRGARALTTSAVSVLDLATHHGVHPRLGVVDVVPFVPYLAGRMPGQAVSLEAAVRARDTFGQWAASTLGVPSFSYGASVNADEHTLPEIRRGAFRKFGPDFGPSVPHRTAGALCIGARDVLVAWNLWISGTTLVEVRALAATLRKPGLRTLALAVHDLDGTQLHQLSCNVIDPWSNSLLDIRRAAEVALVDGARVVRAELVGLIPLGAAQLVPKEHWGHAGISEELLLEVAVQRRDGAA